MSIVYLLKHFSRFYFPQVYTIRKIMITLCPIPLGAESKTSCTFTRKCFRGQQCFPVFTLYISKYSDQNKDIKHPWFHDSWTGIRSENSAGWNITQPSAQGLQLEHAALVSVVRAYLHLAAVYESSTAYVRNCARLRGKMPALEHERCGTSLPRIMNDISRAPSRYFQSGASILTSGQNRASRTKALNYEKEKSKAWT